MWDSGSHFGSSDKGWSEWWNQELKGVRCWRWCRAATLSTSGLLLCWKYLSHPLNFYPLSPGMTNSTHSIFAPSIFFPTLRYDKCSGCCNHPLSWSGQRTTGQPSEDRPAERSASASALTPPLQPHCVFHLENTRESIQFCLSPRTLSRPHLSSPSFQNLFVDLNL